MTLELRTRLDRLNWAFLLLALVLAGIHLYLGIAAPAVPSERAIQFVVIGLILLVGPVVYLTDYWRPVLYVVGIGFVLYLGVLWLLSGMEYRLLGIATGITATVFILLGLYLFINEESSVST